MIVQGNRVGRILRLLVHWRYREGYARLAELKPEDIVRVHDEAAKIGRTEAFGIREIGTIEYLSDTILSMAFDRFPPIKIAAFAMRFLVSEQAFWDANHRTGFEGAQMILRVFRLRMGTTMNDAAPFVRSIDFRSLSEKEVRRWIRKRIRRIPKLRRRGFH